MVNQSISLKLIWISVQSIQNLVASGDFRLLGVLTGLPHFVIRVYIHDVYVEYDEGAGHAAIKASSFQSQCKTRSLIICL